MKEKAIKNKKSYLENGFHVVEFRYDQFHEYHVTMEVSENVQNSAIKDQLQTFLALHGNAKVISANIFSSSEEWMDDFLLTFSDLPASLLLAKSCQQGIVATIFLHAISGTEIFSVSKGGQKPQYIYEDRWLRLYNITNLLPVESNAPLTKQIEQVFQSIEEALQSADMSFNHLIRTWFYIENIIPSYPAFNEVRTNFFIKHKIFDGLVPASTGIGAKNYSKAGLYANIFAISAKSSEVNILSVPSPMQCAALDYSSSFSRAVEISTPVYRKLIISGTASIDEKGLTIFRDSVKSQIARTMEVVKEILSSRGMDWSDVIRSIVYFKHARDCKYFYSYLAEESINEFPCIILEADICRDNLLFEIEVDGFVFT